MTSMTTNNDMYKQLFCESYPELNPSLSLHAELKAMDSQSLGWWGLGWWQAEAIKQACKVETLRMENEALRALLAKTSDEVAFNHAKRMCG